MLSEWISIRAPAWGATLADSSICFNVRDFNPRSRVGSDVYTINLALDVGISIRAPAWGATAGYANSARCYEFQSALPRGERQFTDFQFLSPFTISIRAPAWGATHHLMVLTGCRGFQSALPRGERLNAFARSLSLADFNPRSRVGSDYQGGLAAAADRISIRAPAWGATEITDEEIRTFDNFNPRSRVGSDFLMSTSFVQSRISIRAPAWGATRVSIFQWFPARFQSALPRGERQRKQTTNHPFSLQT